MAPAAGTDMVPRDFLFEIGTEELPAAAARFAAAQTGQLVAQSLATRHIEIAPDSISVWVTPRRIAVFIRELAPFQKTQEIVERGPVASRAFEDGKPTKAAEGFARAKGIPVDRLELREHEGQQFVFAVHSREGRPTTELLAEICAGILHGINFPRTMRWDAAALRFSRPVRWLVTKYGSLTVEYEVDGLISGDMSRGHRFLAEGAVRIDNAGDYREILREASVIVDQEERRRLILEQLAVSAGRQSASFIDPAGELEEVIYLVENPSVHAGIFGEVHLRLPDRVLITCMQSHQRYFPLTDRDGSLMAGFLYVMNGNPDCSKAITEGNERVLEGRIEDAEFSFEKDLKVGIEAMAGQLDKVVFHRLLGSLAQKTARLEAIGRFFADLVGLPESDTKTVLAAARLSKADQVSIMVQEFADLEGYIGSVYARMDGYPSDVCVAIEEHFLPTSAGGGMPSTVPGAVLSIADRIDNIVGSFAVDEVPTGSRDPYGIRRAAAGLAAVSNRFGFDFDIEVLLAVGQKFYQDQGANIVNDESLAVAASTFVFDRIQHRLVENGMPVEVVEAARASGITSTLRLEALIDALDNFRGEDAFEDLHTAYFRCAKIAAKAGTDLEGTSVDESLFQDEAEGQLHAAVDELEPVIQELTKSRDYESALKVAAGLRHAVDRFFEAVMVMDKDEKLRKNRLALVMKAAVLLRQLGDPMRVAAAPQKEL